MMKSVLAAAALALAAAPALAEGETSAAEQVATRIVANVNGMVCDFCAQAVTKVFKREPAVDSVDVDLDAGAITIALKPGQTLDDGRVEKLVRESGYALVSVDRPAA